MDAANDIPLLGWWEKEAVREEFACLGHRHGGTQEDNGTHIRVFLARARQPEVQRHSC